MSALYYKGENINTAPITPIVSITKAEYDSNKTYYDSLDSIIEIKDSTKNGGNASNIKYGATDVATELDKINTDISNKTTWVKVGNTLIGDTWNPFNFNDYNELYIVVKYFYNDVWFKFDFTIPTLSIHETQQEVYRKGWYDSNGTYWANINLSKEKGIYGQCKFNNNIVSTNIVIDVYGR